MRTPVTQETLSRYMAYRKGGPDNTPAGKLLEGFSAAAISKALKTGSKASVDLGWCIQQLIEIVRGEGKDCDRLAALKEIKDLLIHGASQDTGLMAWAEEQSRKLETPAAPVADPFKGQKLKVAN